MKISKSVTFFFKMHLKNLVVYLFGVFLHYRIFHSFGDVTITGEGLQILTYARHSWSLSSEGSLTCHTYCDTVQTFIMVMSDDTHTCCLAFGNGAVTACYNDLGLSQQEIEPRFPTCEAKALPLRHRGE